MILHGIEYQRPTSLNMRILADHVTYSFLAFMKSIFHFCLGCYCGGYSQNGRSNLSSSNCLSFWKGRTHANFKSPGKILSITELLISLAMSGAICCADFCNNFIATMSYLCAFLPSKLFIIFEISWAFTHWKSNTWSLDIFSLIFTILGCWQCLLIIAENPWGV